MVRETSPPARLGSSTRSLRSGSVVAGGLTIAVGIVLAVLLAVGLSSVSAGSAITLTVVRLLAEIAAVLTIGFLLHAAFLTPPQRTGVLAAQGYASVRRAGWAALVWAFISVVVVLYIAADALGQSTVTFTQALRLLQVAGLVEQGRAWLIVSIVAAVIALGCRFVLSWGWTATLFGFSVAALIPLAATGHSSSGGAHDIASDSLLFHLVFSALWVGGLIAVFIASFGSAPHLQLAVSRYSKIALVSWAVLAVSGVVNALVRLPLDQLFSSAYGLMVVGKVIALIALGGLGYAQRKTSVRHIVATGSRASLLRLGGVEILLMLMTMGLAATLSRTPAPSRNAGLPSPLEVRIGYGLDGPPTVTRLLFDWRFNLIFGSLAIVMAVIYLLGVRRLSQRGDAWPLGRTTAWLAGCLTVLFATSSGIGRYAPAMFSIHMESHMLLSMLAPIFLVLGGPITLALRVLPTAGKDNPPGPREWLLTVIHSAFARTLTHPVVVLILFVSSFYALYFSGLFDWAVQYHWAHVLMNAHFLIVGYLFYWTIIGIDPAPRKLAPLGRLALLFASLPFHAFFGIVLMGAQTVLAQGFYQDLQLPWVDSLLTEQRLGGGIAWAAGEIPLLVVMIALLIQWARSDQREAHRQDRKADSSEDTELAAYNAMLRTLAERER